MTLGVKRSDSFNKWEKWLSQYVDDIAGTDVVLKQQTVTARLREIGAVVSLDLSKYDSVNSIVRNSVRKLIRNGWVRRVDVGTFVATEATNAMALHPEVTAAQMCAARAAVDLDETTVADLMGTSTTHLRLIEDARVRVCVWEAQLLIGLYGIVDTFNPFPLKGL